MHEVTTQELMVFVVLGFSAGIFTTFYLARLFEVIHMWRLLQEVILHLLLMCVKILEDVEFLRTLKRKHMHEANFTEEQIEEFEAVDERSLTNWKDSVILAVVSRAPKHFRSMLPFGTWEEAVRFMEVSLKDLRN